VFALFALFKAAGQRHTTPSPPRSTIILICFNVHGCKSRTDKFQRKKTTGVHALFVELLCRERSSAYFHTRISHIVPQTIRSIGYVMIFSSRFISSFFLFCLLILTSVSRHLVTQVFCSGDVLLSLNLPGSQQFESYDSSPRY
jgi:hypothetical protein